MSSVIASVMRTTTSGAESCTRSITRSCATGGRTCHSVGWYSGSTSRAMRPISVRRGRSMSAATSAPSTFAAISRAEISRPVRVSQRMSTIWDARRGMMPCQPSLPMPLNFCGRNIILIATSLVP